MTSGKNEMPNTVRLHRVLAAKPEKIYRAFIEPDALAKWLPPDGFTARVHHSDPKVGGTFRMSFRNFTTGHSHSFGGEYLELVPHECIRYTDRFDDPNLAGDIPGDGDVAARVRRHGRHDRAGRPAGRHSRGGVLPRLATVIGESREAGGAGDHAIERSIGSRRGGCRRLRRRGRGTIATGLGGKQP